jgi:WD40 repeat protein
MVYDISRQQPIASWKNPTRKYVQSVAFAPDGRTLATVSNDTVARFWDTDTGRETVAYTWNIGPLKAVAFAADGLRAAASGKKGTIIVWDVE